jgi:hypothetical protein
MPRYTEVQARAAIADSLCYSEALRRLGMRPAGGNHRTLKRYVKLWQIPTDHFDPRAATRAALRANHRSIPLEQILVEDSTYARGLLKRRLYENGLKRPVCELCGQDENWRGKRMSLILDHINGRATDHRLENLQIVCPNCAATLDTHCGKMLRRLRTDRPCRQCGTVFYPTYDDHVFCSLPCSASHATGKPQPDRRGVARPPYDQLLAEVDECGYLATGRRYGVSDNAVRKWIRQYERELAIANGRDPKVVEIPRRTWPNRRREEAA